MLIDLLNWMILKNCCPFCEVAEAFTVRLLKGYIYIHLIYYCRSLSCALTLLYTLTYTHAHHASSDREAVRWPVHARRSLPRHQPTDGVDLRRVDLRPPLIYPPCFCVGRSALPSSSGIWTDFLASLPLANPLFLRRLPQIKRSEFNWRPNSLIWSWFSVWATTRNLVPPPPDSRDFFVAVGRNGVST